MNTARSIPLYQRRGGVLRRFLRAWWLTVLCASAQAGDARYLELVTPDFTVISGASEARTRELAAQIGMFRSVVEQSFGVKLTSAMPMRIYALSAADWKRYAQPRTDVAGYLVAQPFASDLIFDAEERSGGAHELMFHEYVHYVLRTFWVGEVPAFLDEGLAEVLSTARFESGAVRIVPRQDHIRFLRRNEWLPFERLLLVKRSDPEYLDHALAPAFYAQAWATVYYGMAVKPAFGQRMTDYVRELSAGGSNVEAAERLIGAVSAEANREIAGYIRKRRPLPATRFPATASPAAGLPAAGSPTPALPTAGSPTAGSPTAASPAAASPTTRSSTTGLPASPATGLPASGPATRVPGVAPPSLVHVRLRALSTDEAALSLGELLLRAAPGQPRARALFEEARALFEEVLERSPDSARARVDVAWAFFLAGDRAQAAPTFDALTRAPDLDVTTRVALARGLFQVAAAESQESDDVTPANRERFTVARTIFQGALEDEANRFEAVNGYVLTSLALEDYPEGLIELAQDAYRVAPRSSVLAVSLALLHELKGSKTAARKYWQDAARSSHTAPMRARVQRALDRSPEE